jgi:hypothetical protein
LQDKFLGTNGLKTSVVDPGQKFLAGYRAGKNHSSSLKAPDQK